MSEPVVLIKIVAYDPRWPILYAEERAQIAAQLGDLVENIDHIGSTSVPGLSAKAITDILVTVARLGSVDPYIEPLRSLGYTYFPILGTAERYTFGKGIPHTHHLHIVEHGGEEHIRPIAFRDYLRTHSDVAGQYATLKRALADRFHDDRRAYNQAKTGFIRSIEAKARG
ncbi:MAG TPA: GrpB family protein [Ktedonobacterales bacterium]|nr:GrpB family protein [Ktedonobacterales bacterium]